MRRPHLRDADREGSAARHAGRHRWYPRNRSWLARKDLVEVKQAVRLPW